MSKMGIENDSSVGCAGKGFPGRGNIRYRDPGPETARCVQSSKKPGQQQWWGGTWREVGGGRCRSCRASPSRGSLSAWGAAEAFSEGEDVVGRIHGGRWRWAQGSAGWLCQGPEVKEGSLLQGGTVETVSKRWIWRHFGGNIKENIDCLMCGLQEREKSGVFLHWGSASRKV